MTNSMKMIEDIPEYEYIYSQGKNGVRPVDNVVFPQGGYAIMRSSWDDEEQNATWMMLLAATFSSTHKHSDDLSFLLYHKGDLFVEAGKRDYNYANEQTAWVYSGYAHNVLLINDEDFPIKVGNNGFRSIYPKALETRILDYNLDEDVKWVKACQKRYKNIVQERTLKYDKLNHLVCVEDEIISTEGCKGTLLYHIAEGVDMKEAENGWDLYRDNVMVASVVVKCEEKEITTITKTEGGDPYYTWIFGGDAVPKQGSLIKIDVPIQEGQNRIAMEIYLK